MTNIPFFTCNIPRPSEASRNVNKAIDSRRLSSGAQVAQFESEFAKLIGVASEHCVAVNSGTSALHLALATFGVTHGDEVIVPPQTFVASALSVLYTGATVRWADIEPYTGNIDPYSLRDKVHMGTKAIMAVHWGGQPANVYELKRQFPWIPVIEDAAQALGAVGIGEGDAICYSFQATKHLTTGDGGMVVFRKREDADQARKLSWFGIDRANDKADFLGERIYTLMPGEVGFKYHMNEVAASIGLSNIGFVPQTLSHHRKLAAEYFWNLKGVRGANVVTTTISHGAWWFFPMFFANRDHVAHELFNRGVPCSVVHRRIDRHPVFITDDNAPLMNQTWFDEHQLNFPIHVDMSVKDVRWICEQIKEVIA